MSGSSSMTARQIIDALPSSSLSTSTQISTGFTTSATMLLATRIPTKPIPSPPSNNTNAGKVLMAFFLVLLGGILFLLSIWAIHHTYRKRTRRHKDEISSYHFRIRDFKDAMTARMHVSTQGVDAHCVLPTHSGVARPAKVHAPRPIGQRPLNVEYLNSIAGRKEVGDRRTVRPESSISNVRAS